MIIRTLCLFLLLSCALPVHPAKEDAARPNVVVILADDVGYSDLGCYGGEVETPNLDALAKGGVRFTQFYNTARCCPTRASLLTGLYPHQAGMGHMMSDKGLDGYRGDLNNKCVTIPEVLRDAGYRTYAIGKWHLSRHGRPNGPKHSWPLQRGFEKYYGTIWGAASYFDPGICRGNTWYSRESDPEYQPDEYYFTDALSDNAVTFLEQHEKESPDKPFFMYVAYTAAHWPLHAREKDIAKYRGRFDAGYDQLRRARLERMRKLGVVDVNAELSPTAKDWNEVPNREWELRCMEVYAAMLDSMDQGIGRIVGELKRQGRLDNTLILYMQDNGGCAEEIGRRPEPTVVEGDFRPLKPNELPSGGEPKQTRDGKPMRSGVGVMPGPADTYIGYGLGWANVSNTPFREYKHWVHEGGISTPLIAHWPKGIPKERQNGVASDPSHLIDVMATCVDVAGAAYPKTRGEQEIVSMQGVSLRPAMNGKPIERAEPIFWEHEGNRAVREGKWKLVAKEDQPWELYDISGDRSELHNLADDRRELVAELAAKWEAYADRANVRPLGGWKLPVEERRRGGSMRLKPGVYLSGEESPAAGDSALTVTVEISQANGDGVLVAQGGRAHGYALYVKDGKLAFDLRRGGKLETVVAEESGALGSGASKASAVMTRDGNLDLYTNGQRVGHAKVSGLLARTPGDGVSIGSDAGDHVGDYGGEFAYDGKIREVLIETEQKSRAAVAKR